MSVAVDEVRTALHGYKDYACDAARRAALAQDKACTHFIVQSLSSPDPSTVQVALEVLELLSSDRTARSFLRTIPNIEQTVSNAATTNGTVLRPGRFITSSQTKQITLDFVDNLTEEQTTGVRSALLKTKGVVSIYFTDGHRKCIVRTRPEVKFEAIRCVIDGCNVPDLEWIYKNRVGDEVRVSVPIDPPDNDADSPSYLPEPGHGRGQPLSPGTPKKALVRCGNVQTGGDSGWWSRVTSFLSDTMLW